MKDWTFYIAGVKFHQAKSCVDKIKKDDFLKLVPEPDNKYDPNAIIISYSDTVLGYVPMKFSAEVSAFMEIADNPTCTVVEINPTAPTYEQLKVKIYNSEK